MLKEVVASKAAKLIAACVCPVAGTTALTVSVPEVRDAVHRATAPKAKAKPRVRERAAPAQAQAVAVCPEPADTPVILANTPLISPLLPNLQTAALPPGAEPPFGFVRRIDDGPFALPGPGGGGIIVVPPPGPGPGVPPPTGVIPEPKTWMQLLIGFGVIGGATRTAYRRERRAAKAAS